MDRNTPPKETVEHTNKSKEMKSPAKPRYSDLERHETVKRFVDAYIAGEIKLNFPTKEEFEAEAVRLGLGKEDFGKKELQRRMDFRGLVSTFTGATGATEIQVRKATNELFDWIVSWRMLGRIVGDFLTWPKLELRVLGLERDVQDLKGKLEEFEQIWRVRREV